MSDEAIKILVADKLAPEGLEYMQSHAGVTVDSKTGLSEDELASIIGQYHGLLVRSGVQVTAKVLAEPGNLRAIARAGVGVDNIDLDAATAKGVLVMNSAEASTLTTCEHAFALMMALSRNIGPAFLTMRGGGWNRKKFVGHQLAGKTLGLVGLGRIGHAMAERALAFDMKVLAYDPIYNAETALDGRVKICPSFKEMVEQIDIVSFHVPLNDNTRNMLNAETLAAAKDGLMVVNAARGGVIDNAALLEAIESGKVAGAAIDVYETEPPAEDDPLRACDQVLLTPHLGASTVEAQQAVSMAACAQLLEFLRGEGLRGAVNIAGVRMDLPPEQLRLVDLAQRMARLIAPMCEQGVGDVTVTLHDNTLASAAKTLECMVIVELLAAQVDEPINMVNAKLMAERRGIKAKVVTETEDGGIARLTLAVTSGDEQRTIAGSVFEDGLPRVLRIGRYAMDMVPEGAMMLIINEDRPGMIGLVGSSMGNAQVNIADMAISRHEHTALMVLKVDQQPPEQLIESLRHTPGMLKVTAVNLPPLKDG